LKEKLKTSKPGLLGKTLIGVIVYENYFFIASVLNDSESANIFGHSIRKFDEVKYTSFPLTGYKSSPPPAVDIGINDNHFYCTKLDFFSAWPKEDLFNWETDFCWNKR
jgi:hypothetical protein